MKVKNLYLGKVWDGKFGADIIEMDNGDLYRYNPTHPGGYMFVTYPIQISPAYTKIPYSGDIDAKEWNIEIKNEQMSRRDR